MVENDKDELVDYDVEKIIKNEFLNKMFDIKNNQNKIDNLINLCKIKRFSKDENIFEENVELNYFYIVVKGKIILMKSGQNFKILEENDFFGEECLKNGKSSFSAKAFDKVECYAFSKKDLIDLKILLKRRENFNAGFSLKKSINFICQNTVENEEKDFDFVKNSLKNLHLFNDLSDFNINLVLQALKTEYIKKNDILIRQGDVGEDLYIVREGTYQVFIEKNGESKKVFEGGQGNCVGELALIHNAKRSATVTFVTDGEVWRIPRSVFRILLRPFNETKYSVIDKMMILNGLKSKFNPLQMKILELHMEIKDNLTSFSDKKLLIFFLKNQELNFKFGILSVETGDSIVASTNELLKENDIPFKISCAIILYSEACDILDNAISKINHLNLPKIDKKQQKIAINKRFSLKNIQILNVLGVGGCGKVFSTVEVESQRNFSLKQVKKSELVKNEYRLMIINEKNCLLRLDHPLIMKLMETYNTRQDIFLLGELVKGGNLYWHFKKFNLYGEINAQFYTASIFLAIEYIHSKNVIHRDLKPENVILDENGYIKLVDFGFAKHMDNFEKTHTLCGTPDFIAPEILKGKGHGKEVDLWSLGIMMYEMITGNVPFSSFSIIGKYKKIMSCEYEIPPTISPAAANLISGLLKKDPLKRIGCGKRGAAEIKEHEFFADFDWKALENRSLKAPIIPKKSIINLTTKKNEKLKENIDFEEIFDSWSNEF